jgi:hypothetical protein
MEIQFSTKLTYIPKWRGNREAPESERISITYRNPTVNMKTRLLPRPELRFKYDAQGNVQGGETVVVQDRKTLIDGMLLKIDGLGISIDNEHKAITDAKGLWEAPAALDELIEELAEFFRSELESKVDEKN